MALITAAIVIVIVIAAWQRVESARTLVTSVRVGIGLMLTLLGLDGLTVGGVMGLTENRSPSPNTQLPAGPQLVRFTQS